jgi:hypothetical protein
MITVYGIFIIKNINHIIISINLDTILTNIFYLFFLKKSDSNQILYFFEKYLGTMIQNSNHIGIKFTNTPQLLAKTGKKSISTITNINHKNNTPKNITSLLHILLFIKPIETTLCY